MDYEYVVEARDYIRNIMVDHETFSDANTAYHYYRSLCDQYINTDFVQVKMIEPNE